VVERVAAVRRKLIETAMPVDVVSRHAAREKSIRYGHPSTLHLWWSRKPLAAARAVLFAQLVDDPAARPDRFPTVAQQDAERERLLDLVGRLAAWEATADPQLLAQARAEVADAVGAEDLVLWDPFAGGGSIPLEGQRLGVPVVAGDLNPVAVLLERALLELPRRWWGRPGITGAPARGAQGLAMDLRAFGEQVLAEAAERLDPLYPPVGDGGIARVPLAYLWVRTVRCPNPGCGATVPMLSNPWLRRAADKPAWLQPRWDGARLHFAVVHDGEATVRSGRGAVFSCVACGTETTADDVKGLARDGGLRRALRCVVVDPGGGGRRFLTLDEAEVGPPDADLSPEPGDGTGDEAGLGLGVLLDPLVTNAPTYGAPTIGDLHLPRQRHALAVFAQTVRAATAAIRSAALAAGWTPADADDYARDVTVLLGLVVGRLSNRMSTACIWNAHRGLVEQTFIQNSAIAFPWDFAEANPLAGGSGSWATQLELAARVIERCDARADAVVVAGDARTPPAALAGRRVVVSTDPPYFDYFVYSSLSDYFYVWLRRALSGVVPELFTTEATPRAQEIVVRKADGDGGQGFLAGLTAALTAIADAASPDFPMTVYYAYRSTRTTGGGLGAWEAFLGAVRAAGLVVTATWPIRTERTEGVKTGRNSVASSIVVVCRRRSLTAARADRGQLLARLRAELPAAVERLQAGGIAPVDLAQAALGPAMAVCTGYAELVDDAGHPLPDGAVLRLVNDVLDEALHGSGRELDPATRFCLAWCDRYGFDPGPIRATTELALHAGASLAGLRARGLLRDDGSGVRLTRPDELGPGDGAEPVWQTTLRLAAGLADGGTARAAAVLSPRGEGEGTGADAAACRRVAYRLFELCLRRGTGPEAARFNALGAAFPQLLALAR
jgi:putative DNA methylase